MKKCIVLVLLILCSCNNDIQDSWTSIDEGLHPNLTFDNEVISIGYKNVNHQPLAINYKLGVDEFNRKYFTEYFHKDTIINKVRFTIHKDTLTLKYVDLNNEENVLKIVKFKRKE